MATMFEDQILCLWFRLSGPELFWLALCHVEFSPGHLVLRMTIPCHVALFATSIASHRTLPFVLLPALRSSTFRSIQFHWLKFIRILVLIVVTCKLLSFEVVVTTVWNINRLVAWGSVMASFHSTFVKVVVDFDRCTDEVIKIFNLHAGSHEFVFDILFQTTSEHSHEGGVIPIGNLGILLEFSGMVGC